MLDAALAEAETDLRHAALQGLTACPKTLPPKFFYDEAGVRLFDAITRLPEYYLTRTEMALLAEVGGAIARLAPAGAVLVEYGTSDETKARALLDRPESRFSAYVPIDVAGQALNELARRMHRTHPDLHVHPLCADFLKPLALPSLPAPRFGFFPGSTIGNLEPVAARAFLRQARRDLGEDAVLVVGADLRKDPALLMPAYDDSQGVTAAFNLNLLRRLNREAGADFDLGAFSHAVRWNDAESRIEMHLRSARRQIARLGEQSISFAEGETIHTENSYKYARNFFRALAASAGWRCVQDWTDSASLFAIYALQAA